MRLWSLHPVYLDSKGLVALWREALLAKAVLKGETMGYKNHPQLIRFRDSVNFDKYSSSDTSFSRDTSKSLFCFIKDWSGRLG